MSEKRTLILTNANRADFEDIASLFRKLTGREPTDAELVEAWQEWQSMENDDGAKDAETGGGAPR